MDLTGGSGNNSLTTSTNSNSVGPSTSGSVAGPGVVTPLGSPNNGYALSTPPLDRTRGLEMPLRVFLVKEYSTSGPVLDVHVSCCT